MKVLIVECKQEISSFNPVRSTFADFETGRGQEILDYHRGLNSEVAGAMTVLEAVPGLALIPTYSARAITSGGILRATDWHLIRSEVRKRVAAAGSVDGAFVALHGAMVAEDEVDPEGALLAELRDSLGEEIPIVVSMDLHGILTDRILTHADAVVAYHTYPHVDFAETGARAARLLLRILRGEVKPVTAVVPIPALVRGNELITATGLFGGMIRHAQAIEASPGGLSAGMFIGNPFTDAPDLRSNSFVVTDGDAPRAEREARAMAEAFWAVREQMQQPLISLEEAVAETQGATGTVILTDAADATSSGASGDSNAILAALTASGYRGRILTPIVDPNAVAAAEAAGIGAVIDVTVGGALDPARFTPLAVRATVRMLTDGAFPSESNGAIWHAGKTALLAVDQHAVIVTSRPVSLYDRSLFYAHGQDPKLFDAVVVKSPHCQPHMFADWAGVVLNVDAPGSTSANLPSLGHSRCARPAFPLDDTVVYSPQVKIFRRPGRGAV